MDRRGPRFHQWCARQWPPGSGRRAAAGRRSYRAWLDADLVRARMSTLEPVSVALKFGFLAVLYLFLLWIARSARRDLRGNAAVPGELDHGRAGQPTPPDATGLYSASTLGSANLAQRTPRLVVERAPGHDAG